VLEDILSGLFLRCVAPFIVINAFGINPRLPDDLLLDQLVLGQLGVFF